MNKVETAARVVAKISLSTTGADATVNAVFSTVVHAHTGAETAAIAGLGAVYEKSRPTRQSRKPRTGENIAIAASDAPHFTPVNSKMHRPRNASTDTPPLCTRPSAASLLPH